MRKGHPRTFRRQPASLHRRLTGRAQKAENRFRLKKIKREVPKEPTVRDVCAECNNGELAVLDGYICELFDRSFAHLHERYERVVFEYDYHRLKRWLLKMCFNSARIYSARDEIVFPPCCPTPWEIRKNWGDPCSSTFSSHIRLKFSKIYWIWKFRDR